MKHLRLTRIPSLVAIVVLALILSPAQQMSSKAVTGLTQVFEGQQAKPFRPDPVVTPVVAPLHFVDDSGPLRNKRIWLHCFDDTLNSDGSHVNRLLSQKWVVTDGEGYATNPENCDAVAALMLRDAQPSPKQGHGPAYWVYDASWPTGAGVVPADSGCGGILCPVGHDIAIRSEWPLVLFNVVASLEWEPASGSGDVMELTEAFRSASAYLADLTDGYMAFGPVTTYTGGHNWEGADMRFQAANDLRPAAFAGGIVTGTITYTPTGGTPGLEVIFRPSAVFLGRGWDRNGNTDSAWNGSDGYRTLVHEWAHYALFLYDEYQTREGPPLFCVKSNLTEMSPAAANGIASAMSWHYTAGELWHDRDGRDPLAPCEETDQYRVHGESDWNTLEKWHAIQGLSGPVLRQRPAYEWEMDDTEQALLNHLFGRREAAGASFYLPYVSRAGTPPSPADERALFVRTDDDTVLASDVAQVYVFAGGAADPARITYQGTTRTNGHLGAGAAGAITLLGARDTDDMRIFVDQYQYRGPSGTVPGKRYVYPPTGEVANLSAGDVVASGNKFGSSLNLRFGMDGIDGYSRLTRVRVELTNTHPIELVNPLAQICSVDTTIGCPEQWVMPLTPQGDGLWTADLNVLPGMTEFPLYNVVRVSAENEGFEGLVRWFRDAGGIGPGHKPTGAPFTPGEQREGPATVDRLNPTPPGECNRVMIMPAANYPALTAVPPGTRIVGVPLDVDILIGSSVNLGDGSSYCQSLSELDQADKTMRLTLFFNEDDIARLNIVESDLKIIRYDEVGWKQVMTSTVATDTNFVAATITGDGIYALSTDVPLK